MSKLPGSENGQNPYKSNISGSFNPYDIGGSVEPSASSILKAQSSKTVGVEEDLFKDKESKEFE